MACGRKEVNFFKFLGYKVSFKFLGYEVSFKFWGYCLVFSFEVISL